MTEIILSILATYTISVVVTRERGPFSAFSRLRAHFATKLPTEPLPPQNDATHDEWIAYHDEIEQYKQDEDKFYYTLWGYGYALSSCAICLGAYASAFIILWQGGGLVDWLAVYGGHLILVALIKE